MICFVAVKSIIFSTKVLSQAFLGAVWILFAQTLLNKLLKGHCSYGENNTTTSSKQIFVVFTGSVSSLKKFVSYT